jgi:hypothetical protein
MAQQTAVEWLVRKLSTELIGEIPLHRWDEIREAVQQAKQMEKEQIVKAHKEGNKYNGWALQHEHEQYYNETFGNK